MIRSKHVAEIESTLARKYAHNIETLVNNGADEREISEFKRTEILRRAVEHVRAYAKQHYPKTYTRVKSKVKGNMKSQTIARNRSQYCLSGDVSRLSPLKASAKKQNQTAYSGSHSFRGESSLKQKQRQNLSLNVSVIATPAEMERSIVAKKNQIARLQEEIQDLTLNLNSSRSKQSVPPKGKPFPLDLEEIDDLRMSQYEVHHVQGQRDTNVDVAVQKPRRTKEERDALYRAAQDTLMTIKKSDIDELKAINRPHPLLEQVVLAVLLLLKGSKCPDWNKARVELGKANNFFGSLLTLDIDKIHPNTLLALQSHTQKDNFNVQKLKTISRLGMILCQWVLTVEQLASEAINSNESEEVKQEQKVQDNFEISSDSSVGAAAAQTNVGGDDDQQALQLIDKQDINELKKLNVPPASVELVLKAVMLLLGTPCQDYHAVRKELNQINFHDRLRKLMPTTVKPSTLIMLKSYTEQPDFNPDKIRLVSKVCYGLSKWVLAVQKIASKNAQNDSETTLEYKPRVVNTTSPSKQSLHQKLINEPVSAQKERRTREDRNESMQQLQALQLLSKSDLNELKSFQNPASMVKEVVFAVLLLLGTPTTDWKVARGELNNDFIQRLRNFNSEEVSKSAWAQLKNYTRMPGFDVETMGKLNIACKGLCLWVLAVERSHLQ